MGRLLSKLFLFSISWTAATYLELQDA